MRKGASSKAIRKRCHFLCDEWKQKQTYLLQIWERHFLSKALYINCLLWGHEIRTNIFFCDFIGWNDAPRFSNLVMYATFLHWPPSTSHNSSRDKKQMIYGCGDRDCFVRLFFASYALLTPILRLSFTPYLWRRWGERRILKDLTRTVYVPVLRRSQCSFEVTARTMQHVIRRFMNNAKQENPKISAFQRLCLRVKLSTSRTAVDPMSF